jgi:phage terminase large subunit-like protein
LICRELEDVALKVARGIPCKKMIFCPPQHGKSEIASKNFPAWTLGRWPDTRFILGSYNASFAAMWGRRAREVVEGHCKDLFGITIKRDSRATDHWELEGHRGILHTSGRGGGTTGHPCEIFLIDDPVKDREEAESEPIRAATIEWYQSVVTTRLPLAVVIVMTPWHVGDLGQWLLETDGNEWEVVRLPLYAEENDQLGRRVGEQLCPSLSPKHTHEQFQSRRRTMAEYAWAGLMQLRPIPAGGGLFKSKHEKRFKWGPGHIAVFPDGTAWDPMDQANLRWITCDPASKDKEQNDYTAIGAWGVSRKGRLVLLELDLRRLQGPAILEAVREMKDRWECTPYIESTTQSAHLIQFMRMPTPTKPGIYFRELEPGSTSKMMRALPFMALWDDDERGVWLPEELDPEALRQLYAFPQGTHDDFVDMCGWSAKVMLELSGGGAPPLEPNAVIPTREVLPAGIAVPRPAGF